MQCRICFEEEGDFLSPCKCNSVVHENCLIKWNKYSERDSCEICLHDFTIIQKKKYTLQLKSWFTLDPLLDKQYLSIFYLTVIFSLILQYNELIIFTSLTTTMSYIIIFWFENMKDLLYIKLLFSIPFISLMLTAYAAENKVIYKDLIYMDLSNLVLVFCFRILFIIITPIEVPNIKNIDDI